MIAPITTCDESSWLAPNQLMCKGAYLKRMSAMQRLSGKVAVVTGASSGIGLATAQRFVREGAFVFIVGRDEQRLQDAITVIESNDDLCTAVVHL
jgi:NADPH:quinone reductase-like Zn-dependent oxidoreductase